ncbi:MAG: hypothetical protein COA63_014180 [Methylophaga sp.]|nr:hypothetical protein [Methylophaga sp.]
MYVITAPLFIQLSKKKRFYFNLNNYRNAHFHVLSDVKIGFKELVKDQIKLLPRFSKINLTYIVYPKTKRLFDIANVCSIVDKFFSDALVSGGKLPDDDYTFLPEILYRFGEIDKENPRVEIIITPTDELPIEKENEDMQITLNEEEIFDAIKTYVRKQIKIHDDQEIDIDFKAGRKENGHTATLTIRNKGEAEFVPTDSDTPSGEPETEEKTSPEIVTTNDLAEATAKEGGMANNSIFGDIN